MGVLDKIVSMVEGNVQGAEGQGGLIEQALNLINDPAVGGLSGLINKFQNNGLGDLISSWVSTGQNQAISGDQMTSTLGMDKIGEIAKSLGISHTDTANGLASILPQLIDKLTPQGQVPEGNLLEQDLSLLSKQFLKRS